MATTDFDVIDENVLLTREDENVLLSEDSDAEDVDKSQEARVEMNRRLRWTKVLVEMLIILAFVGFVCYTFGYIRGHGFLTAKADQIGHSFEAKLNQLTADHQKKIARYEEIIRGFQADARITTFATVGLVVSLAGLVYTSRVER